MKPEERVDRALAEPGLRAEFEDYKRLIAEAEHFADIGDTAGHRERAEAAHDAATRIIEAMGRKRGTPLHDMTFGYLFNKARDEMNGPRVVSRGLRIDPAGFHVEWPSGRPPKSQPDARAELVQRVRDDPGLSVADVDRIGHELGAWGPGLDDDRDSVRRRVRRIRRLAAN